MKKIDMPTLWYENKDGDRVVPDLTGNMPPELPPGFIYQNSRFPNYLRQMVLTLISDEKGVRSEPFIAFESGWPMDLMLAMTRPSLLEKFRQLLWYGSLAPRHTVEQAILRAAGCEHCINVLAHRYGLTWGYRDGGPKDNSHTICEACRAEGRILPPINPSHLVQLANEET